MKVLQHKAASLWNGLSESGQSSECFVEDAEGRFGLADLLKGSALFGRGEELQGRSVLLATKGQLTTAAALMELDGVARRIILCPPDLSMEHLPYVIDVAEVDGIVSDRAMTQLGRTRPLYFSPCSRSLAPGNYDGRVHHETEWIMLTSGTTGLPKLVVHTLASLTAAIGRASVASKKVVWSTFYDIRRYGGLQIFLRAVLNDASLVLSSAEESTADFLGRAARFGVTHISGTPSHWRRALMSPSARLLKPQYVRLSGEAVDQAVLNQLHSVYPEARIVHAFASTEAGVAFEVTDVQSGFPAETLETNSAVEMKVEDRSLRIRSAGAARCYLGAQAQFKDATGWVDTGDIVELRDGRYFFAGRRDGVINVGGLKVHPEEVEAVLSRHPDVHMCMVRAKKSPITGALVIAEVVLKSGTSLTDCQASAIQEDILQLCRETLPAHKVPAAVQIVPMLALGASGKVQRRDG